MIRLRVPTAALEAAFRKVMTQERDRRLDMFGLAHGRERHERAKAGMFIVERSRL
jgi:hypothetical protein